MSPFPLSPRNLSRKVLRSDCSNPTRFPKTCNPSSTTRPSSTTPPTSPQRKFSNATAISVAPPRIGPTLLTQRPPPTSLAPQIPPIHAVITAPSSQSSPTSTPIPTNPKVQSGRSKLRAHLRTRTGRLASRVSLAGLGNRVRTIEGKGAARVRSVKGSERGGIIGIPAGEVEVNETVRRLPGAGPWASVLAEYLITDKHILVSTDVESTVVSSGGVDRRWCRPGDLHSSSSLITKASFIVEAAGQSVIRTSSVSPPPATSGGIRRSSHIHQLALWRSAGLTAFGQRRFAFIPITGINDDGGSPYCTTVTVSPPLPLGSLVVLDWIHENQKGGWWDCASAWPAAGDGVSAVTHVGG